MSAFRIDVYGVSGVRENGHTNNIARVQISTRANCVGGLSFTIPTVEYVNVGMGARKWYYLYHRRLGFVGRFRHLDQDFDENAETVTIKCEDALASLIDVSLDFNMSSVSSAVSTELNRVLGRAGWTATLANDADEYSDVSLDYQGINAFQALNSLCQMQRGFFALSGATSIKFGRWTDALRDSSAYTLITNAATSIRKSTASLSDHCRGCNNGNLIFGLSSTILKISAPICIQICIQMIKYQYAKFAAPPRFTRHSIPHKYGAQCYFSNRIRPKQA